ncbi:MAG: ribonuclease HI family protein [Candidatus Aenigmarchaeota archaeon]|nr:ribonuclease HI family protein [Candidatus Aenigmarchaeota archaeon]
MEKIKIYTDGASRGNPGPGAIAYMIVDEKGALIAERAEFIGACTNNIAEYKALIAGLKAAEKLAHAGELTCISDSQLMISQMKGEYKVKKGHLKDLHDEAKALEKKFAKVEYVNVRRTDPVIQKADRMVNYVLDSMSRFRK